MMLVPPCPAKAFPQRHIPKSWACELWDKTLTAFKSVAHVSFPPTTNEDWCLSSAGPDQGNGIFGLKPNCLVEEDEQNKAKKLKLSTLAAFESCFCTPPEAQSCDVFVAVKLRRLLHYGQLKD